MAPGTTSNQQHTISKRPRLPKTSSGAVDHLAISESLGYRIFRKQKRKAWHPDEDMILRKFVIEDFVRFSKLPEYKDEKIPADLVDWDLIADKLPNRRGKDCRKRWSNSLDPSLRKGKWTTEEDDLLLQAYEKYGPAWQNVAGDIEGRTEDQCSKRYIEVLNPDTKDRLKPWSLEEDLKLISGVKQFGTKWRSISSAIKGRPSLTCRNRWRRIMTDVAKKTASKEIMKAVGVLDSNGKPTTDTKQNSDIVTSSKETMPGTLDVQSQAKTNDNQTETRRQHTPQSPQGVAIMSEESKSQSPSISASSMSRNQTPMPTNENKNGPIQTQAQPQLSNGRFTFQRQPLAKSFSPAVSLEGGNYRRSPSPAQLNNPHANTTGAGKFAAPSKSQTEWKFSLLNPSTNEELPSFSGSIQSQEQVHQLIELAKYNGVSMTIHQHIHHHYSPQSPILDPETSLNRFSHFNYLPPLTEVPKLTSSSSAENTIESSGSNKANGSGNEPNIMRLLNNDKKSPITRTKSPKSIQYAKYNRAPLSNTLNMSEAGTNNDNKEPSSNSNVLATSSNVTSSRTGTTPVATPVNKTYLTEDIEEELDFWETMRSITQPKPTTENKPVSQHHPLHYNQPSSYRVNSNSFGPADHYPLSRHTGSVTGNRQNGPSGTGNGHGGSSMPQSFGGIYINDLEDEEEMENYANQYGMYYNVVTNNSTSRQYGSGSSGKSSDGSSGIGGAVNGQGSYGVMPFNPS